MKVWFRIMMVNVMMWFLQTRSRWRKMQENWSTYICSILTCCKPSHNLVSMAHKNEKLILIFSQMVAAMIWDLCDPCEFFPRSKYLVFMLQKSVKIGLWKSQEKVRKFHYWWPVGTLIHPSHSLPKWRSTLISILRKMLPFWKFWK